MTIGLLWTAGHSQQFMNPELAKSLGAWQIMGEVIVKKLEETGTFYDTSTLIHNVFAALKSSSFPTAVANNISQQCLEDSQYNVHNLYANQIQWALQSKLNIYDCTLHTTVILICN